MALCLAGPAANLKASTARAPSNNGTYLVVPCIAKLALATITHDLVSLVGPKQPQMLDFAHQIWSRHKFPTCLSLQTPTMVLKSARSRRVNSFPPPFSTKHGSSAERQRSCTAPAARSPMLLPIKDLKSLGFLRSQQEHLRQVPFRA